MIECAVQRLALHKSIIVAIFMNLSSQRRQFMRNCCALVEISTNHPERPRSVTLVLLEFSFIIYFTGFCDLNAFYHIFLTLPNNFRPVSHPRMAKILSLNVALPVVHISSRHFEFDRFAPNFIWYFNI